MKKNRFEFIVEKKENKKEHFKPFKKYTPLKEMETEKCKKISESIRNLK